MTQQDTCSTQKDIHYMKLAIAQAKLAAQNAEVPVGAIVVQTLPEDTSTHSFSGEKQIHERTISKAYNLRETNNDPSAHAEFLALTQAAKALNRWRLSDCTVYVTMEPCIMCAGLMHQARIKRCVFGAPDKKAGALGTLYNIHEDTRLNHNFEVCGGILQEECAQLLKEFFKQRRKKHQNH